MKHLLALVLAVLCLASPAAADSIDVAAVADDMVAEARTRLQTGEADDTVTAAQLIAGALALAPEHRGALATREMMARGTTPPDPADARVAELVRVCFQLAQALEKRDNAHDQLVAKRMYELILTLDPQHEGALLKAPVPAEPRSPRIVHVRPKQEAAHDAPDRHAEQKQIERDVYRPRPLIGATTEPVATAKVSLLSSGEVLPITQDVKGKSDRDVFWRRYPDYFEGKQFTRWHGLKGFADFKVDHPGWVVIVCDSFWGHPPRHSGGPWKDRLITWRELEDRGWTRVSPNIVIAGEDADLNSASDLRVYARYCDAGETHVLQTTKYFAPIVVLPDRAPPAMFECDTESAQLKPISDSPFTPLLPRTQISGDSRDYWVDLPERFHGAAYLKPGHKHQGVTEIEVTKDGYVIMATTDRWLNSGNASGGWQEDVTSKQELIDTGWELLDVTLTAGRTNAPVERSTWLVFRRVCKAGERIRVRTEKYSAPVIIVPAAAKKAANKQADLAEQPS